MDRSSQYPIEQRGLSDVGAADDGDRRRGGSATWRRATGREAGDDLVQQIAGPLPVLGGDLDHRLEAHGVELDRAAAGLPIVGLVDRDNHRHVGRAQAGGNLLVGRHQPFAVDDEHDDVRGLHRAQALRKHQCVQRILAGPEHPASIGERERDVLPLGRLAVHVAGGPRNRGHDCLAGAGDAVGQGGLADVRPADQNHRRTAGRAFHRHDEV